MSVRALSLSALGLAALLALQGCGGAGEDASVEYAGASSSTESHAFPEVPGNVSRMLKGHHGKRKGKEPSVEDLNRAFADIKLPLPSALSQVSARAAMGHIPHDSSMRAVAWAKFWNALEFRKGAEIGVWKGDFSKVVLETAPSLATYYLVDPWRHLDQWNKPFNVAGDEFERIYTAAMEKTKNGPHGSKVVVLRDTSTEAAKQVADGSLDFVYIDGDHTYEGCMRDLVAWAPKVKPGGLVAGDDYEDKPGGKDKHGHEFAPTKVISAVRDYINKLPDPSSVKVLELGSFQFGFVQPR